MKLDDKLREILESDTSGLCDSACARGILGFDKDIVAIKQAFSEAGYHKAANLNIFSDGRAHQQFKAPSGDWLEMMTGQEWYDRFEAEIEKYNQQDTFMDELKDYIQAMPELKSYEMALLFMSTKLVGAAKKAAGLDK